MQTMRADAVREQRSKTNMVPHVQLERALAELAHLTGQLRLSEQPVARTRNARECFCFPRGASFVLL